MMGKQIPAEAGEKARILAHVLSTVPENESVTYKQLNTAAACDVQHGGRGALTTARRIALREHRAVFESIPNYGLKRLDAAGVSKHLNGRTRKIGSQGRIGTREADTVKFDELPKDEAARFSARRVLLAVAQRIGNQSTQQKVAQLASGAAPLGLPEALAALQKDSISK